MNKTEFIKAMADEAGFTQKDATLAYDAYHKVIESALKRGEKVQLAGYGTYDLHDTPEKIGHNPHTGEEVKIPACKKPVLKFAKAFKDGFNA